MRTLVPSEINTLRLTQITGEVVAPSSVPNSRNFASGSLGLNDLAEFETRPLVFVAYDSTPHLADEYVCSLEILHRNHFHVVNRFETDNFPTDGMVYRLKSNSNYDELGHTSKHPRGAFALKERVAGEETTLVDVVWQLGKSGVVSPVAILDPIVIGEATVSRATLHNIEYIRDLNLEIGCKVEVIRSGDIIPRVVRRLD
jgi:DNA ligase (NAD+)